MRIAFHANQLSVRGTEVALYDYANHNERLLGNESLIITKRRSVFHNAEAIRRFEARFPISLYDNPSEIDRLLQKAGIQLAYCIKGGRQDRIVIRSCPMVVHAVFEHYDPHGTVYAYVSDWLARKMSGGRLPFVPHMVDLPDTDETLRSELGIPPDAIVFGRTGGQETFDLEFAHRAVYDVAQLDRGRYFLFLYTKPFCEPLPNIIHLPPTADLVEKVKFINTCDAMLHAGHAGETFGLAVAEFSARNKPVLTWSGSYGRAHIEHLGDRGIYYDDYAGLLALLRTFAPNPHQNYDVFSERFSPERVMDQFRSVFIDGAFGR